MHYGQIVLIVFACIVELGGFLGFRLARSKPSLIAGTISAFLLFASLGVTFLDLRAGLWCGTGVSVLLCIVFAGRFMSSRKFMPSGMLLALSVVVAATLAHAAYHLPADG